MSTEILRREVQTSGGSAEVALLNNRTLFDLAGVCTAVRRSTGVTHTGAVRRHAVTFQYPPESTSPTWTKGPATPHTEDGRTLWFTEEVATFGVDRLDPPGEGSLLIVVSHDDERSQDAAGRTVGDAHMSLAVLNLLPEAIQPIIDAVALQS